MDKTLKKQAEMLFDDMGLNMTTAFTVFAKAVVKQGKIPFEIAGSVPNATTIAAIEEAERISRDPDSKKYANVEELFAELRSECTE
jgi:DNA-damage-inducible protein J